jgi:hypothetical protein
LNPKLGTIFPSNPILDFHAKIGSEMDEFVAKQIFVQSHYPIGHSQENPIFKTFTRILYKYLDSGILLQAIFYYLKLFKTFHLAESRRIFNKLEEA